MENIEIENTRLKTVYLGSAPETLRRFEDFEKFEITQTDTAIEAANYLQINRDVDVVIAETRLPGTDGIGAFNFLTKRKALDGIPFILLSHQDEPEMFKNAFEANIDDYYNSPVEPQRVFERILFFKKHKDEVHVSDVSSRLEDYKTPFIKRLFDIVMAGGALLVLSPLMLGIIIAIKLESKGPFYYVSKRVGANWKEFGFLKFRSMRVGADQQQKALSHLNQYAKKEVEENCSECAKLPPGEFCSPFHYDKQGNKICERIHNMKKHEKAAFLKLENDPRITRVGKFIRNTSIDELPQLINILKGDMSVVGNRPLPYDEAVELTIYEERAKRFHAAAGLTGLWQVELRGRGGNMSEEERFALDTQYAENNSFLGDIKLIFRTVKVFVQRGDV